MSAKFELKGKVTFIQKLEDKNGLPTAGIKVAVNHKGTNKVFTLVCFNKIADYLLTFIPVKHEVEVWGHFEIGRYGEVKLVANKINDLTHQAKKLKKGSDPFDLLREKKEITSIQMLDKKTMVVIRGFENTKAAARYVNVPEARIMYAIRKGKEAGNYYWRRG